MTTGRKLTYPEDTDTQRWCSVHEQFHNKTEFGQQNRRGRAELNRKCKKSRSTRKPHHHPDTDTERWCSVCDSYRPFDQFYPKRRRNRDELTRMCIPCTLGQGIEIDGRFFTRMLIYNWKTKYGITPEDYLEMEAEQNGACAICKLSRFGPNGFLYPDHCHKTGKVRKLLCPNCNTAIGMLGDDPQRIRAAAEYVEAYLSEAF